MHPRHLTATTAGHWAALHIALLPVFPLLVLGLLVPLWVGRAPMRREC